MPLNQRLRHILLLGLPIIGGMLSQSLLNLIDAAMVGHLGETALAGVGIGSYANFMAIALVMGLGSAVQTLVARRHGEGRDQDSILALNAGLLLALGIGLPIMLLCWLLAPQLLALLNNDPAVLAIGIDYFRWRVLAVVAVGLSFAFRGYWNSSQRAGHYLRILLGMHLFNILCSYALIHGVGGLPRMGAAGAGLGTCLALHAGALSNALSAWHERGFLRREPLRELRAILQLALPNSVQQFLFASGIALLFWIIGQVGTSELAIAHVLVNLSLLLILPAVGLGMAATTLVSRSLGAGDPLAARRWGWEITAVAALVLLLLGMPFWLAPHWILARFVHDPELIALGMLPLCLTGAGMLLDAFALVLAQAMLGAGASRMVMLITLGNQWLLMLPLAWLVGPLLGHGLLAIWAVYILHRIVPSLIFATLWQRRDWSAIRL